MSWEDNGQPNYKLDMAGRVIQVITDLIQQATLEGRGPIVKQALKIIFRELRKDPQLLGELRRSFKKLGLLEHVAVVPPLVVHLPFIQKKSSS